VPFADHSKKIFALISLYIQLRQPCIVILSPFWLLSILVNWTQKTPIFSLYVALHITSCIPQHSECLKNTITYSLRMIPPSPNLLLLFLVSYLAHNSLSHLSLPSSFWIPTPIRMSLGASPNYLSLLSKWFFMLSFYVTIHGINAWTAVTNLHSLG
jgi:hypothetical protein